MTISAAEQLLIELVNRARLDPLGEAARYGSDLNAGLQPGTIDGSSKQVLAPDAVLHDAAEGHSDWLLANNIFSHIGEGGSSPQARMAAAGYNFAPPWSSGENIAWTGSTRMMDEVDAVSQMHRNLFLSSGHRVNLLNDQFRDLGVATVLGAFRPQQTTYTYSYMLTENFAVSSRFVSITGVVHSDLDGDDFYTPGEGVANTGFTVSGATAVSAPAGGYALQLAAVPTNGSAEVAVATATTTLRLSLDMAGQNAKLDIVDGDSIRTSASAILQDGVRKATLLGGDDLSLTGSAADETLIGNRGDNLLSGGAGADTLQGGAGDDTLEGGAGADRLEGGAGFNTVSYHGSTAAVLVNLATGIGAGGHAAGDVLVGISGLRGSAFGDVLFGASSASLLDGGAGNDVLRGGDGADTIQGGLGDDNIGGGGGDDLIFDTAGANVIWAGYGNDTVDGGTGNDTIYGGAGRNQLFGNDGDDLIFASPDGDFVDGGAGSDTIRGSGGDDTLLGGQGQANIGGGAGDDLIHGAAEGTTIWGGLGDDTVHAGMGRDIINGGPGADVFVFASADHIGIRSDRDILTDFTPEVDAIDLSALNTAFNGTAGLIGGGAQSFYYFAQGGLLIGDQNGDGLADWVLELTGRPAVTLDDFLL